MSHPDTNEIIHEDFGWEGKCFYDEPTGIREAKKEEE